MNNKNTEKRLKLSNLVKSYRKRRVVDNIGFEIAQGEVVGLLGPNGAGKTTTFYMIVGLIKPDSGNIFINDLDITGLAMYKRARSGIGYLPQEPSVFRKLTVAENLEMILELQNLSKNEIKTRRDRHLNELSIEHVKNQKAYTLSGGERRRLEIARTLVTMPDFLLLDEPFAGIDPKAVTDIQDIIQSIKKKNIGVLITDHNVRETLKITDRSFIINKGEILISGESEKLINSKKARDIYLGENFSL